MRHQPTVPTAHILTTGDIVKLKEPYKPADFPQARNSDWPGFGYGIVVEIINTQTIINGCKITLTSAPDSHLTSAGE